MSIIYKEESYNLVGAFYDVFNEMGSGFLEAVYQEVLPIEFQNRKIPFVAQPKLEISYKGQRIRQHYEPDFVVYSKIIIELKCVSSINDRHRAQTLTKSHIFQTRDHRKLR